MDNIALLVTESQNGNQEAFKSIYKRLNNRLFNYALLRTSNREDALDIVQETFIELWKALKKFSYQSEEKFYSFVFTIAKRKLYRHYKTKGTEIPTENLPEEVYETENGDYRYLFKHIHSLSSKYQDVLKLRYWSGMTFREIASVLDVREATAKVWHFRAVEKLKIILEKNGSRTK